MKNIKTRPTYDEVKGSVPEYLKKLEAYTDHLEEVVHSSTVLLSNIWADAHMALDDAWDRSDSGFEAQIDLIEEHTDKYDIEIKAVYEPKDDEI